MGKRKDLNYISKYRTQTYRQFIFCANKKTDADLIEYLSGLDNFSGYIKQLIKKDMKKVDM